MTNQEDAAGRFMEDLLNTAQDRPFDIWPNEWYVYPGHPNSPSSPHTPGIDEPALLVIS